MRIALILMSLLRGILLNMNLKNGIPTAESCKDALRSDGKEKKKTNKNNDTNDRNKNITGTRRRRIEGQH